jgi:hypothetical protein
VPNVIGVAIFIPEELGFDRSKEISFVHRAVARTDRLWRLLRNLTGTGSFFACENMCLSPLSCATTISGTKASWSKRSPSKTHLSSISRIRGAISRRVRPVHQNDDISQKSLA